MELKELYKTAALANLSLTEEEADRLRLEVTRMLDYFSTMLEVDTGLLEPTTHALIQSNILRGDSARPGMNNEVNGENQADSLLDNAPELEERFFVVPNVL